MIAIFRYLTLKTRRDGSLWGFLLLPMFCPAAGLIGASIASRQFRYPLFMNVQYTAVANANFTAGLATAAVVLLSSILAFWSFRPEIASRSAASLLFAARPVTIISTVILFATSIAAISWSGAIVVIRLLTAAMPTNLWLSALQAVSATLALSAAGVLLLMISSQPAMVIGSYAFGLVFLVMEKRPAAQIALGLAMAIVCTSIATFLLERRCAT